MNEEKFKQIVEDFFTALREKTLLVIIDTASKNEKAVFSLVSFREKNNYGYGYESYAGMLKELGSKSYGKHADAFVNYCAGRYSLYILEDIGNKLRGKGVELPKDYYNWIQYQHCI